MLDDMGYVSGLLNLDGILCQMRLKFLNTNIPFLKSCKN